MNKLQEIKESYKIGRFGVVILPENFDWLIAQAEKVEAYEKSLKMIAENEKWIGKEKLDRHIQTIGGIASRTLKNQIVS